MPVYQVIEDVAMGPGYYKVVLEAAGERLEGHAKAAKPLQMQLAQALLARLAQRGRWSTLKSIVVGWLLWAT